MGASLSSGATSLPVASHFMHHWPLYVVEFKAGRHDFFYLTDARLKPLQNGDLVIVEADRGKDLGKVIEDNIMNAHQLAHYQATHADPIAENYNREVHPKRIDRLAKPDEVAMLVYKSKEEAKAMAICQAKIRAKKLHMEVVDAEYQWDRRKLTFYFVADHRIDFRDLVRDLFKTYKTRIWMCAVNAIKASPPQPLVMPGVVPSAGLAPPASTMGVPMGGGVPPPSSAATTASTLGSSGPTAPGLHGHQTHQTSMPPSAAPSVSASTASSTTTMGASTSAGSAAPAAMATTLTAPPLPSGAPHPHPHPHAHAHLHPLPPQPHKPPTQTAYHPSAAVADV